jgi:MFS family permease
VTSRLFNRGFVALIVTQFLGAMNDNVLKQVLTFMVTTGLWANAMGEGSQSYILLCLTLPFILLSGVAGEIADRFSKQRVMVVVKMAELPIALTALAGLWLENLAVTVVAMVLLAAQSAFFGPAKYGVIPELVGKDDLSRANGSINMMTNIAIIAGTLLAGPLSDMYFPAPATDGGPAAEPVRYAPGIALVLIAIAGIASVMFIPKLSAAAPSLRFSRNPFASYVTSYRDMARGPIIIVAFAWAYFYMIGAIALLILPEYKAVLGISYQQNSYLLGTLGVAIGVGSVLAGVISGRQIKPRLIPVGAVGMSAAFVLLGAVGPEFWTVLAFLVVAGLFAGLYIVPLQALLQKLAPDDERGRFLGTANAISFVFSSTGAVIYWLAANRLGLAPNRVFLVCAVLAVVGTGWAMLRLRRYLREHATV